MQGHRTSDKLAMKLEYLGIVNDDKDEIVRLFDFESGEALKLKEEIAFFLLRDISELQISNLPFLNSINCNLKFRKSNENKGILKSTDNTFVCELTNESFQNMILLIEPFCLKDKSGFQWLYDINTPIDLLFSQSGDW